MARPIKDNADYFTHDSGMRDDPKIKALRRKFKVEGYGLWCMLLEVITDSDNFRLPYNDEIIAGDFDVDPILLNSVVQYCIQLDLLQTDEGCKTLWSKTLDNRFATLLSKRKRDRGELSPAITPNSRVIASESTQSRVKHSKAKQSKVEIPTSRDLFAEFTSDQKYMQDIERAHPGKNIKLGWEQCYAHHCQFPNPPIQVWEWRQKLNTWMGNMPKPKNYQQKGKLQQ